MFITTSPAVKWNIAMSMSVCLSLFAHISQAPHVRTSHYCVECVHVAVAWFSSDGVAARDFSGFVDYVLSYIGPSLLLYLFLQNSPAPFPHRMS